MHDTAQKILSVMAKFFYQVYFVCMCDIIVEIILWCKQSFLYIQGVITDK